MAKATRSLFHASALLALTGAMWLPGITQAVASPILSPVNICSAFPQLCSGGSIIENIPGPKGPYTVFTIPPCRILDTREPDVGGPLAPHETKNIKVRGTLSDQGGAANCGIPAEARGVFINIVAVEAEGSLNNHVKLYPFKEPEPEAAVLSYQPGVFAIANGTMIPICDGNTTACSADLILKNGPSASSHFVIDVTGFLAP